MAVLYLTEQQAVLRKTSDRLRLEKDGELLLEVPCAKIDAVLIFGNVQVTTQALFELLDHGIELAYLSRSGQLRGQLTPPRAKNLPLRMRQYETVKDESFRLGISREVIGAKIASSAAVLRRLRKDHPDEIDRESIERIESALDAAAEAESQESLLGIEGSAAARYFKALARAVPVELGFAHRQRRPPPDPFNALLSFGYVLAGNELQSLLDALGFDPYLGLLHEMDYGRPSLALDLLEEFRAPLIDRLCLHLVRLGTLGPTDFEPRDGGILLARPALQRYLAAYEAEIDRPFRLEPENDPLPGIGEPPEPAGEASREITFRDLFRRQSERLARTLVQGDTYRAFRLPC